MRQCPLFAGLDDVALDALSAAARIATHAGGETLFAQGGRADRFFVVLSGKIKVFCISGEGREQVLHLFGPGQVCGEVPMFQGSAYPATAVSVRAARTLALERKPFLAFAREHPEILSSMLASLSERLRHFVGMIEDLSLRSVPARLARYLLEESRRSRRAVFRIEGSKAELAARLGTTPESLSRALTRLQVREAIVVRGRTIRVKDERGLEWISEGARGL